MRDHRIIRDARVLEEHFIPKQVVHRDGQMKTIRDCLEPVTEGKPARNSFLYGPAGTGKTCIARYVCDELSAHTLNAENVYVNCWKYPSRFKILLSVLNDMGVVLSVHRKGTPTDELLDTLRKKSEDRQIVVILDEIDKANDTNVLYDLLETDNVSTILISNQEAALHDVDQRIRSRLSSAEFIEFQRYRHSEIVDILQDRVEWGLVPDSIRKAQLETIADHAEGDARVAIDTLRVAAERAETAETGEIREEHIEEALPEAFNKTEDKKLEMLNTHQELLYEIIEEEGEVKPGDLYEEYRDRLREHKADPVVDRTLRKYLDRLVTAGLVEAEGDGRWRTYRKA